MPIDETNGYETIAWQYIQGRGSSLAGVGVKEVREWARRHLHKESTVLEVGCGTGLPITKLLVETGARIAAIEPSRTLAEAFRRNFPDIELEVAAAENSALLNGDFDAVVAWGVLFLMPEDRQRIVLPKLARAVRERRGKLLFTAPRQICEWNDAMTGVRSASLGAEEYGRILEESGMRVREQWQDVGENHYYFASYGDR